MIIKSISLDNFRSKSKLQLELGRRLTILIGENGSGKTSVLDGLAIGLGSILTYLPGVSGISFKNTDIRQIKNQKTPDMNPPPPETEEKIKDLTKATIRCIPLDNELEEGISMISGKPSTQRVIFAKSY